MLDQVVVNKTASQLTKEASREGNNKSSRGF